MIFLKKDWKIIYYTSNERLMFHLINISLFKIKAKYMQNFSKQIWVGLIGTFTLNEEGHLGSGFFSYFNRVTMRERTVSSFVFWHLDLDPLTLH